MIDPNSLRALPWKAALRHSDVVLAIGVAAIVAVLIIPLPALVLDLAISLNLAVALTVLIAALFAKNALELASFPSILLLTTLLRLALNISTTRQILAHGRTGQVVTAFGEFVVGGDLAVGTIVFVVLTVVQLLVIGKGAERVAEVGARFSLDALPGKQMAIEASLGRGVIDDKEARAQRAALTRESQLFGNMDGAMKFVKGDAVAGLVLCGINLAGGAAIGVVRNGLGWSEALDLYAILSIGDALVSQIPALLITLAAGLVVTRVESAEQGGNLGRDVQRELLGSKKTAFVVAGLLLLLGFVPGLPALPFWLIASGLVGYQGVRMFVEEPITAPAIEAEAADAPPNELLAPSVVEVGLDLDPCLAEALFMHDAKNELLAVLIPELRDALYAETGVRYPGIRVRADESLPRGGFAVRVKDVPVHQASIAVDLHMAMSAPDRLAKLGVAGERAQHPLTGSTVALVPAATRELLEASGIAVWSPGGRITLELAGLLRRRAKEFVGIQEVAELVENMEKAYPALTKEVVPKIVGLPQLVGVLRRLVDEGVSIRDMKSIFEALGEHGRYEQDVMILTERVRAALSQQLAHAHAGSTGLNVLLLDALIEDTIRSGLVSSPAGVQLALDPGLLRQILDSIRAALEPAIAAGSAIPAILTTPDIRRMVRKMLEVELPRVPVLSFDELPGDLSIHPLGRAVIAD